MVELSNFLMRENFTREVVSNICANMSVNCLEGNLETIHKVQSGTITMQNKVGSVTNVHFLSDSFEIPDTKIIFTRHVHKF
jgi:hypothetical protein